MTSENREIAIKITNVKKMYKLGQIGGGTLKADLQSWWAKKHGKEDPNVKIGQEERARLVGQTFMALNGIDLTVYKGEALGIIGSNGAGKSTLLKLLSQVTAPTEGTIELWGRVASMLEVGTGFNKEMTGRENIYMNGAILGMTKAEIDAKMEEIIEFSEVREFIDTPVKRYSSGMFVKLAFSVAAYLDSEIMIMDEVLAVGDMAFQKKCLDKMREVAKKEGRTVLYVSHNMSTIRQLCDRCVVLDKGKKIFEGEVENAIARYMNTADYELSTDIDLSEKRVDYLPKEYEAKITRIQFIEKKSAVFEYNEPIKVKITIIAKKKIDKIGLRMEIQTENGIPVGTTMHNSIVSLQDTDEVNIIISNAYFGLVNGRYFVTLVLYESDELGTSYDLDIIEQAFYFEIIDTYNKIGLKWNDKNWGKIKFEDINVEKVEHV